MAKAASTLFHWRYFLGVTQSLPLRKFVVEVANQLPLDEWSKSKKWLVVSFGTAALLFCNGRLVLAASAGSAVMLLLYVLQERKVELPLTQLRKSLASLNNPMGIAIAGGGSASFITYLAASIWSDSHSPWIAIGLLLQGASTVTVLLLLRHLLQHPSETAHPPHEQVVRPNYQQLVAELTDADALRRLMAVRQLIKLIPDLLDKTQQRQELADYFRLLSRQEKEPIVRAAALNGLCLLNPRKQINPSSQPRMHTNEQNRQRNHNYQRVPAQDW